MLNPLATNDYTIKDSFVVSGIIQSIPNELFNQNYKLISFDSTSLLTYVPLNKAAKINFKRMYLDNVFPITLQKWAMNKFIVDIGGLIKESTDTS